MNTATFCYTRLKGDERNWQPLFDHLKSATLPPLVESGVTLWGAWSGLFGVGSNELVLMTAADRSDHAAFLNARLESAPAATVDQHLLVAATARPADARALTRQGLYVFRFFDVRNSNVEEIARLSLDAWTSFEATNAYRAEPQGLFCQSNRDTADGVMLLCTWYDGFESWQASREPPAQAAENFRRRHMLTKGTVAFATRLIPLAA